MVEVLFSYREIIWLAWAVLLASCILALRWLRPSPREALAAVLRREIDALRSMLRELRQDIHGIRHGLERLGRRQDELEAKLGTRLEEIERRLRQQAREEVEEVVPRELLLEPAERPYSIFRRMMSAGGGQGADIERLLEEVGRVDVHIPPAGEGAAEEPGFGGDASLNHLQLGRIYLDEGLFQEAAEELRQAVRLNPELAEAHAGLGLALLKLGRTSEAVSACREALRLRPDLARAHSCLGLAYAERFFAQKALEHFNYALKLRPNDKDILYDLACGYAILGDEAEALRWLQEAVQQGYCHLGQLRRDSQLDSIRGREDFARLCRQVAASAVAKTTASEVE